MFIIGRIFSAIVVIFGVSCLVFFLIHLIPGDPVEVMLGESARVEEREALRQALGLDLPLFQQFVNYYSGLVQFDLGTSLYSKQSIADKIVERLPATIQLSLVAIGIAIILAIPLGILSAAKRNSAWDQGAMFFSLFGISIPNFWLGPMLILFFSIYLGWFPVSGYEESGSIILPALTLGTGLAAILSRMTRSTLLEVLNEDYIRTARAKGLSEWRVWLNHGFRNALLPLITILGLQLGALLGGAVITETVFSWPGIGSLLIESILQRDYPMVQACVLLITLIYVGVNTLTDILYLYIDPRTRDAMSANQA